MKRPVQHTAGVVAEWLRDERRVVAGTLVAVDGSAPLDVGASVYVEEGGTLEGSVTGGCVEGAVAEAALQILERGGGAGRGSRRTASRTSWRAPSG